MNPQRTNKKRINKEKTNKERANKIIACIDSIPKGKVASYGQIADLAGITRGHRVVAKFLREQELIPDLPWHRVIRADGKSGFPSDSQMFVKQMTRLKSEGVLSRNNKIDMKTYAWQPDLDFILFHPDL